MRRVISAVLVGALASSTGACLKTSQYRPTQKGRVYLYVEGSQLGVFKDGAPYSQDMVGNAFGCDAHVSARGFKAQRTLEEGQRHLQIAGMLNGLSVILPPLLFVSPYFIVQGANELDEGTAALVDAVNLHNDAGACFPDAAVAHGGPR